MQENPTSLTFAQRVKLVCEKLDKLTPKSPLPEKLMLSAEVQLLHAEASANPALLTDEAMCAFGPSLRMGVFSMFCLLAAESLTK